jgi:hypothetical protein
MLIQKVILYVRLDWDLRLHLSSDLFNTGSVSSRVRFCSGTLVPPHVFFVSLCSCGNVICGSRFDSKASCGTVQILYFLDEKRVKAMTFFSSAFVAYGHIFSNLPASVKAICAYVDVSSSLS